MEENRTRSSAAGEKRRTWGFTLVELIVVIAILAVLAGVAYPVYTGYITKANEAADLALLGQVNESFASALYDVGYNDGLPEASFELNGETVTIGTTDKGETVIELNEDDMTMLKEDGVIMLTDNATVNTAFGKYFAGNENTPFKAYKRLGYNDGRGGFYGILSDGSFALTNGWKMKAKANGSKTTYTVTTSEGEKYTYNVENDDIDNFNGSTFGTNMDMSSTMGEVDGVVSVVSKLFTGDDGKITLDESQLTQLFGAGFLEKLGLDPTNPESITSDQMANAVVMLVAEKAAAKDPEAYYNEAFGAGDGGQTFLTNSLGKIFSGDMPGGLADLATAYGMITGYANSDIGRSTLIDDPDDPDAPQITIKDLYDRRAASMGDTEQPLDGVLNVLSMLQKVGQADTAAYAGYFEGDKAKTDFEGYLAAMGVITDNQQTLVEQGTLNDSFANENLGAILDALFSSGT